jgi:hypothetical protein
MKSAKEFYYEYYEKTKNITSFQKKFSFDQRMRSAFPNIDEIHDELREFIPTYSNDYKIQAIFNKLTDKVNNEISNYIQKLFIVQTWDPNIRAYIRKHKGEFDGEIIFIDLGISNLIIYYAHLLSIFVATRRDIYSKLDLLALKDSARSYRKIYNVNEINIYKNLFENWLTIQNEVRDFGTVCSQFCHEFILCHEISHYLLGHTELRNFYNEVMPVSFEDILSAPPLHQREFHADIFSMFLSSGAFRASELILNTFSFTLDASIGTLLALTIFGQQSDPFKDSDTHPCINHRYGICINLLKRFSKSDMFTFASGLMKEFQIILFNTQKYGLGQYYKESSYTLPWEE